MNEDTIKMDRVAWWWRTLNDLYAEYCRSRRHSGGINSYDFDWWMAANHGVGINRDVDGNISIDYTIMDEMKHMVFLLKYA